MWTEEVVDHDVMSDKIVLNGERFLKERELGFFLDGTIESFSQCVHLGS